MGLALSSSHHYSSQPRVRAQSDRHSSSNALQLILVNVLKKNTAKNQSQWNINKSKSSSNYCIKNFSQSWHSLQRHVKYDAAPLPLPQEHHLSSPMPSIPASFVYMHRYTAVLLLFSCFPHRKDYENIFLNLPKWKYCLQGWSGLFCWFVTLKSCPRDILKTDRGKGKFFPLGFLTV